MTNFVGPVDSQNGFRVNGAPISEERFADLVLTPTMLTTAPFYDPASSGPGLVIVPAPGAGKVLIPRLLVVVTEDTLAGWATDAAVNLAWQSPFNNIVNVSANGLSGTAAYPQVSLILANTPSSTSLLSSVVENQPLVVSNQNDLTAFGMSVVALNQGTKTFTFQGAVGVFTPGLHFTMTGSTGNDGTYTVVSSSPNADHVNPLTDVIVSQAIPSAVADGGTQLTGMGTRRLFVRAYYVVVPTRSF